jgi:hypothetical protein
MASGKVEKYINAIRNSKKRDYARRYWSHYTSFPLPKESPDHGGLSFMGAQSVRMEIHHLAHQKD